VIDCRIMLILRCLLLSGEFACKKWNNCNGNANSEPMARYTNSE
jgi:hypothetical protein